MIGVFPFVPCLMFRDEKCLIMLKIELLHKLDINGVEHKVHEQLNQSRVDTCWSHRKTILVYALLSCQVFNSNYNEQNI